MAIIRRTFALEELVSMNYYRIDTPIGELQLVSDGTHLHKIQFAGRHSLDDDDIHQEDTVICACTAQLNEYFAGNRQHFNLPLGAHGTEFQQSVWSALSAIPYGELRSYKDIAEAIGKPKAVRAVGAANGRNPLPIVVPCHRVIGSNGTLTGFAGGLALKTQLLTLEGAMLL
jgi:methylated-DNA-[protein]-cysteine S-methyltransferase